MCTSDKDSSNNNDDIRIVFSDIDGTLVHYPTGVNESEFQTSMDKGNRILKLPASATGMQGIISSQTLAMSQRLRHDQKIKLILVSGARTSTLLKRLPFLPKADAYCSEAGGRIFMLRDKIHGYDAKNTKAYSVIPEPFDGADKTMLEPFEIVEDLEWRQRMEDPIAAGPDGHQGVELDSPPGSTTIPVEDRKGALWAFARQLITKGFVIDTRGYSTCFRVNVQQQTKVSPQEFEALLKGELVPCPPELATSTNLGCIDYYPAASGKKNT